MKKNFKKSKFVILPALATLVLTGVASVTGTVAWFTANTRVTATGMTFSAKAESNLFIATATLDGTDRAQESSFGTSLTQNIVGSLKPASSIDGKAFYGLKADAKVDGSGASTGDYEPITHQTPAKADDLTDYLEYVFQLKATNVDASATQNIIIDTMSLKYASETSADGYEAFRAAVFVEEDQSSSTTTGNFSAVVGTSKGLYAPTGYAYFDGTKAIGKAADSETIGKQGVTITTEATSLAEVSANTTAYYKVVVRLWLEGEDKKCNVDTFKAFTAGNWTLDLGMKLQSGTEGAITALGYNTTAQA